MTSEFKCGDLVFAVVHVGEIREPNYEIQRSIVDLVTPGYYLLRDVSWPGRMWYHRKDLVFVDYATAEAHVKELTCPKTLCSHPPKHGGSAHPCQ